MPSTKTCFLLSLTRAPSSIVRYKFSVFYYHYHYHYHFFCKFVELRRPKSYNAPMTRKTALPLLFALCAVPLFAAGPKTVKDFLLTVPERYLGIDAVRLPAAERLAMIEIDDTANGWLRLVGRGDRAFEGWIEMAMFRRGLGGPMLAVAVNQCGPLCEQRLTFLRHAGGEWLDLTAAVFQPLPAERVRRLYRAAFPDGESADDPPVLYRLPRHGTDIVLVTQEAIAGREVILVRLRLINGRFVADIATAGRPAKEDE